MSALIPTGKAAPAVGVSRQTLTVWAKTGEVTPAMTTMGGHYRWDLANLQAQVRRMRVGGNPLLTTEHIARVIHAANRELQRQQGDPAPSPEWDDAPDYQRQQAIAGVRAVLDAPDLTAERSHELWCERMRAAGWTYGERKDPDAKTHPTLLEWSALPAEQQYKDRLFIGVVRALTLPPA